MKAKTELNHIKTSKEPPVTKTIKWEQTKKKKK